jgi:tetratricopeptide (TPR) repeat protein
VDLREAERLLEQRAFRGAHGLCLEALANDPACADAFFLLAMIAAEHDNFVRAAQLLDRAIELNGASPRYHAQRGKCLMRLGRSADACAAADAAAALNPDDALTLDTIGVVHSHAGFHERAIGFFARAAERDRANANILHNLGVSRQFCGDLAGAEAAFRAELELRPHARRPYASIVQLARQTPESNFLSELEAQFAAARDTNERLSLAHALAKTCEDLGDYQRALDWLDRGKQPKRAELGDVMDGFARAFAAAEANARTPVESRGCANEEPIFVFGMPRTGTTLVDRILSSHPDVMSAGELGHFSALAQRIAGAAEAPSAELYMRADKIDFALLGRLYVESTRPRTGATRRFIDKMPVNFLNAALIHRALPEARMICLRRHPMDACLSNYRQLFGADAAPYFYTLSFDDLARYYKLFDGLAARWRACLPPDRYIEVRYEALVADLEGETRRMLDFCGLSWDPRCLDFHTNAAPVATASSAQVRLPIYSSSVGRWRRYGEALTPLRAALAAEGFAIE